MNLPMLGSLKPNQHIPEWLVSDPLEIPFFGGLKLPVTLETHDEADEKDVNMALASFLNLGIDERLAISRYVFQNYRNMAEQVSEEDLDCQIESEEDVWQHLNPTDIYISRRDCRDRAIYVVITANCDWEREHGLQIVYRRGSDLVRVSDQDGHLTHTDAYALPEEQDRIVD
jgi:hypothetical protein